MKSIGHKHRKAMIAMAVVLVFVAVIVPACRMVGCSMGGAMSWGDGSHGLGIYGTCGGTYVTTAAPAAAVPLTAYSLLVALAAALIIGMALMRPPMVVERIRVHASDPPPPPEDPRGERLRI